jgi:16S rRNA processing protein RimM
MTTRLEVGRIGRAHGLRGEVHVVPITNRTERFAPGSTLYIGDDAYLITSARVHQKHWLVHFAGVDDRSAAEALRNRVVTGDPLGDAPEGEVWVHELIGSEVRVRSGEVIGRVVAVEENPAHDLLVLDNAKLIPIVFVTSHDDGVIVVDIPEGLLDL